MINARRVVAGVAALVGFAGAASAVTYFVPLEGSQEVPPNASTATGMGKVKYNPNTNFIKVTGDFSGLGSNVTVAHLHGLAGPGFTAPPIFGFTVTGGTSGTFSGSAFLTDPQEAGLFAGLTYINVHSVNFGPGEIRGQVIPAPGVGAVFAGAALAFLRRRR